MSQKEPIIEPTETIHLAAPSWGPAILAFGILGLVAGTFATGFMFPAWTYAVAGLFLAIGGLRSLTRKGKRSFYGLPREKSDARAELPLESFSAPHHD